MTEHRALSQFRTAIIGCFRKSLSGDVELFSLWRARTSDVLRIVSLAPSVTSILLELGAGRELVGVSKWCRDVADAGRRPAIGDCWKLDVREMMRLRPSLLIGSVPFAAEAVGKILDQPVAFLALNPRSLADIESDILVLGRVVKRRAAAERLVRRMRRAFRDAARAVAGARNFAAAGLLRGLATSAD